MRDKWFGWCAREECERVREALLAHDPGSTLLFVDSAQELRRCVQQSSEAVGAVVGPANGGVTAMNVAAALARDAMAREVVLVVTASTEEVRRRARDARIDLVLEAARAKSMELDDLDEPALRDDDPPTVVMLPDTVRTGIDQRVPAMDHVGPEALLLPWEEGKAHEDGAPIVTLVSGRGGVGKTSLVSVMAVAASAWGMRVAVLDLDLSAGNLYAHFGLPGPADLSVLAEHEKVSAEDVLDCGREAREGVTLWGGCDLPEMAETVHPKVSSVLEALRSSFDLVLVDTSVTLTDAVAQALQACDRLVIVVDDRPGAAAAQRRLGALAVRLGVARTRMVRLANRCGPRGRGEPRINRADLGLETARPLRVLEGGAEVTDCLAEGKPEDLLDLGSRFAESAAASLATLLAELGRLPQNEAAHRALETKADRPLWTFGRRKGAV